MNLKHFQDDAATWVFYVNTFYFIFCTPWSDLGERPSACWLYLKHAPTSVFLNNFWGSTTATSVAEFYLWDRTDASSTWKLKDYYFFNDAATEVVYLAGRLVYVWTTVYWLTDYFAYDLLTCGSTSTFYTFFGYWIILDHGLQAPMYNYIFLLYFAISFQCKYRVYESNK